MTEQEYRAHPGVNKSTLWEMRKSPAHYKYALEHQNKDSPALRFGRAVHMAVLQPRQFGANYVLAPDIDRRTKVGREEWQQFIDSLGDRELITSEDFETVNGIYRSVRSDPDAVELLKGTRKEVPMIWTDDGTGIQCKCRVDAVKKGVIIDLKTCMDASTTAFMRDALKFGYDVQAAHYLRGYRAKHKGAGAEWWFIAVEKTPPYAVNVIKATDAFIDRGTWQLIDLMDKLAVCRETDTWPGYGRNELVLPEWAMIPDGE